jgi:hypothetical protein
VYDVEIVIKRQAALPFRVPEVASEERVKEIIESFLAAWGLPAPDSLRDTGVSLFADRLAEAGRYESSNDEHRIRVKRLAPPTPYAAYRASLGQNT